MEHTIADPRAFVSQGYTLWQFDSSSYIQKIIPDFLRMLHRPPRKSWAFDHIKPGDPDTGLVVRQGSLSADGTRYDIKTFFHYRHYLWTSLARRGITLTRWQRQFLENCGALYDRCIEEMQRFVQILDPEFPGLEFSKSFKPPADFALRLLAYQEQRPDEHGIIAQTHIDRDSITMALAESRGGLEVSLDPKGSYVDAGSRDGMALMMAGGKSEGLVSRDGIVVRPLYHRVRALHEVKQEDNLYRWAVVFFANAGGFTMTTPTHPTAQLSLF